jgi:predicted nucleic-acid-binding Zn-ribbon protein
MQPCGSPAYYNCPKCENKNVEIYPEKKIRYTVVEPESYI